MAFQVFENGKPAQFPFFAVDPSWDNSIFESFEKAENYANAWLGSIYGPLVFELDVPEDYNGYGDCLVIREVPDANPVE